MTTVVPHSVIVLIVVMAFIKQLATARALSTKTAPTRIFCYGDSLTAGTASPNPALFPYAPHLEAALKEKGHNIVIKHRGLPGWTAGEMVNEANGEAGLRPAIRAGMPLTLVIILAGSNDLAYSSDADSIADSTLALHKLCLLEENVPHTLAIGIPPSGYQSMNQNVAALAKKVNNKLKEYCQSEPRATFVSFPFGYEQNDEKWATDGLHFTPEGYRVLGSSLAPAVEQILLND